MKKLLIGGGVAGVLVAAVLLGGLVTGAFAQGSTPSNTAAITADEAKAAALAANPGANVVASELDKENGALVYEVELDNGLEVAVDANTGAILGTEQEDGKEAAKDLDDAQEEVESQTEDADQGVDDLDDIQEEFESQADDALEAPQAEDAPGQ